MDREQIIHEAEIVTLLTKFTADMEPEPGHIYQAEARFGTEGPDNWSRWTFEATPEQIAEATKRLLAERLSR